MLTDYLVTCPYPDCHWFGSLFPQGNPEAWKPALPTCHEVVFECPRCHGVWHAQIIGDDVKSLPLEEVALTSA
jgi:hypothetical protein